ncbi:MAG: hypothetical protein RL007_1827 [Bacteroidota bacterium]|jgi:hypothetical protein
MKAKNWILYITLAGFVTLALSGLLENRAHGFVKEVSERNLTFMSSVAEIKLVLSSVSSTNVPFLSGEATEVNKALDGAQNYLFYINIISLLQLLIVTISKSIIIKAGLVGLLAFAILKATRPVCTKLLIVVLTLNPGLLICTIAVQELSKEGKIDFGTAYQSELRATVANIQQEKSQLMLEHEKQLTQISNGDAHVRFFSRLKEDVSYDVKRAKVDIKGDYAEIRLLVKDAGHTIQRKIYIFCTTVLFCMLLLPIGYALLVYIIYKSLYKQNLIAILKRDESAVETSVAGKKTLFGKFTAAADTVAGEVKNSATVNELKQDLHNTENPQPPNTDSK